MIFWISKVKQHEETMAKEQSRNGKGYIKWMGSYMLKADVLEMRTCAHQIRIFIRNLPLKCVTIVHN